MFSTVVLLASQPSNGKEYLTVQRAVKCFTWPYSQAHLKRAVTPGELNVSGVEQSR